MCIESQNAMPPRCCQLIPLYLARPMIHDVAAADFRHAFEEFTTKGTDRLYCPDRTCSTFIPKRLIAKQLSKSNELPDVSKVDSFPCPECKTKACAKCNGFAHPGSLCPPKDQKEIEKEGQLLKLGYKDCPYCGQWVRKMYGCNHLECRCGAHWCWTCKQPWSGECSCVEEEDDYREEDEDDDSEGEAANDGEGQNERNLDNHSYQYWDEQGMDFGEEPTNEERVNLVWNCPHSWVAPRVRRPTSSPF